MGMLGKKAASLLGAIALGFALVACGTTQSGPDLEQMVDCFVGSWEMESAEFDDSSATPEQIQEMADLGLHVTLDMDANGDLLIDAFGQQQTGSWEMKDADTLALTLSGETIEAPYEDERLTLVNNGESIVFAKTSDEPVMERDPSENSGGLDGLDGFDSLDDLENLDGLGENGGDSADDPADEPDMSEFSDLFSDEMVAWQRLYVASVEIDMPLDITVGDDDTALVKITGIGTDVEGDTGYFLTVENRTDTDFVLTNATTTLDGEDVWDYATLFCMVPAGESGEGFLYFDQDVAIITEESSCEIDFAALDRDENILGLYDVTI